MTPSDPQAVMQQLQFVAQILNAKLPAASGAHTFRRLLEQDVRSLLAEVQLPSSLTTEILFRLHGLADQMDLLGSSVFVSNKTIVAVAGSFSSGKSSFISSFMEDENTHLPIGIEPMTSIPTYVGAGGNRSILGHAANGGVFEIDPGFYARLSHEYVASFGFNLREILPFISIDTPLRGLQNITFIDMPGYDPAVAQGSYTQDDLDLAHEFASQSHALIWLVGADSHGDLTASDLDFLLEHHHDGLPLYIVLNKADLRPETDVLSVLEKCRDTLNQEGIPYEGICAYNSVSGQQIRYRGKTLKSFLRDLDEPQNGRANLLKELNAIFRKLYSALSRQAEQGDALEELLAGVELDLHELGFFKNRRVSGSTRDQQALRESVQARLATLGELVKVAMTSEAQSRAKSIAESMRQTVKATLDHF